MLGSSFVIPDRTDEAHSQPKRARKRAMIDDTNSETDVVVEEMEKILEFPAIILPSRYLKRPSSYRNKGINADDFFREWISDRYVLYTNTTRSSFEFVRDMIKDDAVFVNPRKGSKSQQRSMHLQLFIVFSRFVAFGHGWRFDKVCKSLNVSHGIVPIYTERVYKAICRHTTRWVQWPTVAERKALSVLAEAK
jgi:hypothetical protein